MAKRTALPDFTVEQVVALAKRRGELHVNPLRWKRNRIKKACFTAAKNGLLSKEWINPGLVIFRPIYYREEVV